MNSTSIRRGFALNKKTESTPKVINLNIPTKQKGLKAKRDHPLKISKIESAAKNKLEKEEKIQKPKVVPKET